MNVIIGYDTTETSHYIIPDLLSAGLPSDTSFVVVSATDMEPLPPDAKEDYEGLLNLDRATWQTSISAEERQYLSTRLQMAQAYIQERAQSVETEAAAGAERLRLAFPQATVTNATVPGSPFHALEEQARLHNADLIVVGSQSASALSRFFLGSVSNRVVTHSTRSVRIARAQAKPDPNSLNIIIGFDGSEDSRRAVETVSKRKWAAGVNVRVVTVEEARSLAHLISSLGRARQGGAAEFGSLGSAGLVHSLAESACEQLRSVGINAEAAGLVGDPKNELLKYVDEWRADCVFLGAHGHQAKTGQHLGAVASAIANRAQCSLEIIR